MTCRERLAKEHGERVDDYNKTTSYAGGCLGCPDDYDYLDPPEFCMNKGISMEERCRRCWDRTIPENEEEPKCEKPPLGEIIEPAVKEMTVEEIEKTLGYKIKIVGKE